MNDEILTVKEAAQLLKISDKTAYDWIHIAGFPKLKVGNCIRIHKGQLLDWVKSQAAAN